MGRGRTPTSPPTQPWQLTRPPPQREGKAHQSHGLFQLFQVGKSISGPVNTPASADPSEHNNKQAGSKGRGLFLTGWRSYSLMCYWIPVPSPGAAPDGLILPEPQFLPCQGMWGWPLPRAFVPPEAHAGPRGLVASISPQGHPPSHGRHPKRHRTCGLNR